MGVWRRREKEKILREMETKSRAQRSGAERMTWS